MSLAQRIDALVARNLVFAAFRLPGERPRAFVQYTSPLAPPVLGQKAWWIAPFEPGPDALCAIVPDRDILLDEDLPDLPSATPFPMGRARQGLGRAGYVAAVEGAVQHIRQGTLEKVVLARTMERAVEPGHWGSLFALACERLPNACVALVRTPVHGTWLGASPERLLSRNGDRLEVDALAGTMPSEVAPDAHLWGNKEIEEQRWVTRMVEETLHELGLQHVHVTGPSVHRAGPVAHLHSIIGGSAAGIDVRSVARALHPTPAVGGTPRPEALRYIAATEPRPRHLYAGFWGVHTPERTALFVNIRCMELFQDQALLHVGAGITAGSDAERECLEVERKAATWSSLITAVGRPG